MLFKAGEIGELSDTIGKMVGLPDMRIAMGDAALERARSTFATKRLVQAWLDYYDGLQ